MSARGVLFVFRAGNGLILSSSKHWHRCLGWSYRTFPGCTPYTTKKVPYLEVCLVTAKVHSINATMTHCQDFLLLFLLENHSAFLISAEFLVLVNYIKLLTLYYVSGSLLPNVSFLILDLLDHVGIFHPCLSCSGVSRYTPALLP